VLLTKHEYNDQVKAEMGRAFSTNGAKYRIMVGNQKEGHHQGDLGIFEKVS
jgi:hypothetical protein